MMENKKEKNNKISKSSEKKGNLLIQIDEIMQTFDNEYGPLMLKELEDRLIKTINDFLPSNKIISVQFFWFCFMTTSVPSLILNKIELSP